MAEYKMKAGMYYVGDCCYVLKAEQHKGFSWCDDFCGSFFDGDAKFNVLGEEVCVFNIAGGDGCYPSNIGFEFPVDAGLIGIVPVSLWKSSKTPFGCAKVNFKEDFICSEEEGVLTFGHVVINTDDEEEEC